MARDARGSDNFGNLAGTSGRGKGARIAADRFERAKPQETLFFPSSNEDSGVARSTRTTDALEGVTKFMGSGSGQREGPENGHGAAPVGRDCVKRRRSNALFSALKRVAKAVSVKRGDA
ncbi:hypothetical protein ERJ75_001154200 [Trypanosoma vivax]|nr:hypothetical protein ERJ75_001154200 [Trypanosoma vivax]